MARFTGPVRFTYSGNVKAGLGLRVIARKHIEQIGTPSRRKRGANGMFKVRYTDGTTITVSKTGIVYQAHIHVPKKKEREKKGGGWIVYPYIGWMRPKLGHRVFDGGYYVQYEEAGEYAYITVKEQSHIPCYQIHRATGWEPPYFNEDGTPILGDGINKGTVTSTYTDVYGLTASDRDYPRIVEVLGEDPETKEIRGKETLLITAGDDAKYEPQSTQGVTDFGYASYGHWLHAGHQVVWKGLPSGDLYMITVNYTSTEPWFLYGEYVYVDGKKYETPRPVRSAAILKDIRSKEEWIVITTMTNREELDYTPDDLRIFAARLSDLGLEGTAGTTIRTEADLIAALQNGDPAFEDIRNGWYEMGAGTLTVPLVATNRANYSATDRRTHWRYLADSYGFKFNKNGNRFIFTNYIEGSTATEVDEVELSIDVSLHGNASQYAVPVISHSLVDSLYSVFLQQTQVKDGVERNWGKINFGAVYKDNVRHIFTVEVYITLYEDPSCSKMVYNRARNITTYGTLLDKEDNPLVHTADTIRKADCSAVNYANMNATFFCYLDVEHNDYVIETVNATGTNLPNINQWFTSYSREVYVSHKKLSRDEGSYAYDSASIPVDAPYYLTKDNAYDGYWPGCIRVPSIDGIGMTYPDGGSQHLESRHVIYRHIKRPGWGHLIVHRGHPRYVIATYVERSVSAYNTGMFDWVDSSENDVTFRVPQKQIIMDKGDPALIMELLDNVDSLSEKIKPVVDVMYYLDEDE